MKTNKTILAALALTFTLAGCNNVVENENSEAPVTEETPAETGNAPAETNEAAPAEGEVANEATNEAEIAEEEAPTGGEEVAEAEPTEEAASEAEVAEGESTEAPADTSTPEGKREALEQAIFDNRTQARAIELLFELTPENVEDVRPQLEDLLARSNELLSKAQAALDQLDAQ